jgi:hypothetical protein
MSPVLLTRFCNIFGAESGGTDRVLGGLSASKPNVQWYCDFPAVGRFRMVCEHGHKGQIMDLCLKHHAMYKDTVTFCPRCNATDDHKCTLKLEMIS